MAVGPKEKKTTMKLGMNGVSVGKQQGQKPLKERRKKKKREKRSQKTLPSEEVVLSENYVR